LTSAPRLLPNQVNVLFVKFESIHSASAAAQMTAEDAKAIFERRFIVRFGLRGLPAA
jgi:hypothetical protein